MSTTRSMIWIDFTGKTRMTLTNTFATNGAAIQAALEAVSNAAVSKLWFGTLTITPSVPSAGQFQNVQDYAELVFEAAADGSLARITLPAPHEAIFMVDLETVNPAAIAAVIAAVVGDQLTGTGQLITSYLGGVRRRKTIDY